MKKLFILGDSISIAYGPPLAAFLQGVFAVRRKGGGVEEAVGREDDPAFNGKDSRAVLSFLKESPPGADLLLLNCGLHDIKITRSQTERQVPMAEYRENLESILSIAQKLFCTVLWVNTTPVVDRLHNSRTDGGAYRYNKDVIAYNEAAALIMGHAGIPVIDLYSFTRTLGEASYRDHVHFTPEASRRQAEFLSGIILQFNKNLTR